MKMDRINTLLFFHKGLVLSAPGLFVQLICQAPKIYNLLKYQRYLNPWLSKAIIYHGNNVMISLTISNNSNKSIS